MLEHKVRVGRKKHIRMGDRFMSSSNIGIIISIVLYLAGMILIGFRMTLKTKPATTSTWAGVGWARG